MKRLRGVVGARAYRLVNLYPPYVGAHVRLRDAAEDARWFEVEMRLRPWTQNYFGTHFGGSLYSMCDPFFALILTENLGPNYVVWDKAGAIRFLRPGRGTVRARFEVPPERIAEIRADADDQSRVEAEFTVQIHGPRNEVVARVDKLLSIQRRRPVDAPTDDLHE